MNNFERLGSQPDPRGVNRRMGENAFEKTMEAEKRKQRRMEELNKKQQAKKEARNLAKKVGLVAVGAIAAANIFIGSFETTNGIMNTERAKDVKEIQIESVVIHDGPNLRSDPRVTKEERPSNIVMDFGDEGQRASVPYQGTALYYDNNDPNGPWYGFVAENIADSLRDNSYINQSDADKITKSEENGDGYVWVSARYADVRSATQFPVAD